MWTTGVQGFDTLPYWEYEWYYDMVWYIDIFWHVIGKSPTDVGQWFEMLPVWRVITMKHGIRSCNPLYHYAKLPHVRVFQGSQLESVFVCVYVCVCVCARVCVSVHVSVCPCVRYFNIFHARKLHHQITISLLLPYWALLFVQVGILQGPGQHEYLGRSHWLDPFGWRRDLLGLAITTTLAGQPPHVPQLFVCASPRQTY